MRKIVKRKASFDIMDLDTIQVAKRCFVPALFGHGTEDDFILPHHSDKICESYVVSFYFSTQYGRCMNLLSVKIVIYGLFKCTCREIKTL
jgi:hypothetical protein